MPTPTPNRALLYALIALLCTAAPEVATAQLGRKLRKAAERGAARALERNAEKKTEEAVDEVFSGPEDSDGEGGSQSREDDLGTDGASTGDHEAGEARGGDTGYPEPAGEAEGLGASESVTFSMSSKYDFEPGAEIVYFDDFSRSAVGDFPTGYNTLGGSELVTMSTAPGKFLRFEKETGGVVVMGVEELPENFTLEFDLAHDIPEDGYRFKSSFNVVFTDTPDPERDVAEITSTGDHAAVFTIARGHSRGFNSLFGKNRGRDYTRGASTSLTEYFNDATRGTPVHVAIWRQGKRIRMYVDERKIYDVPLAWSYDVPMAGLRFVTDFSVAGDAFLLGNIRLARGAPDTRSKLETEGKLVSYGITFASGSDEVEPASAGTLKRIAQTLDANPEMRLRITGHTDADGEEDSNMALSERRAASVRDVLAGNYGVDADRLETAGLGESDPVSTGGTPAAKAQNRRVVFEVL